MSERTALRQSTLFLNWRQFQVKNHLKNERRRDGVVIVPADAPAADAVPDR